MTERTELTVGDVVAAMHARYPVDTAEEWDSVGLVAGNLDAIARKVLFAVDPHELVVHEAIAENVNLIISHHPLFIEAEATEAEIAYKSRIVKLLDQHHIALLAVHTNADVAWPGVTDALAEALNLVVEPGRSILGGVGRFANNEYLCTVLTAKDLANHVAKKLPAHAQGVKLASPPLIFDPQKYVPLDEGRMSCGRAAICAGSGASLLDVVAQTDVDVYITSDVKYHQAQEFVARTGKHIIDISHWAAEQFWLAQARDLLLADLGDSATNLELQISSVVTDPWDTRFGTE